jgi:peptide/nickel transport system permease protein
LGRLILGRVLALVPVLFGISVVSFVLIRLVPGDPILAVAGLEADPATLATLRAKYGLDRSLLEQYLVWIGYVLQGDLGRSVQAGRPVASLIAQAMGPTALLAVAALLLSLVIAIPAGIASATRPNTPTDFVASFVALCGLSLPSFWIGILLILAFSIALPWLPSSGYASLSQPLEALRHLAMPAVTLGAALAAATMRMTRAAMLEVLGEDYIRTAHAKGLTRARVVWDHGLRNAALPIVTLIGIQFGQLLGGVVVTETVFSWPGIGKLAVDAIFARDYPLVQGTVLCTAVLFVTINLVTDLAYLVLDPRVRDAA